MTDPQSRKSSLRAATRVLDRAAAVGFDWDSPLPVLDKLHEELAELTVEITTKDSQQNRIIDEFGDLLLVMVNLARHLRLDPDQAIQAATAKFERRFGFIAESLELQGKTLAESNLAEMESLWQQAKQREKSS
ncbi:MAG: MazG nucleotide pyrophosphohydrolase domain-containing protein [Candidatus Pacebacteria bacterium]|nr:MazG nucleotide pyrophosphohydrolase domain-containing protein [Candidatus Paceibacterota bacterium]